MFDRVQYFKSLAWVIGLQWRISKPYFIWIAGRSVFEGLQPILAVYALARLIDLVSRIVLDPKADISNTQVYVWLVVLAALAIASTSLHFADYVIRRRMQRRLWIVVQELLIFKIYELSQEQFDNEAFNTKIGRARRSLRDIWRLVQDLDMGVSASITLVAALAIIIKTAPWWVAPIIILSLIPGILMRRRLNVLEEETEIKTEPDRRLAERSSWALMDPRQMIEMRLLNAFKRMARLVRRHQENVDSLVDANQRRALKADIAIETVHPLVSLGANIYFFWRLLDKAPGFGLEQFLILRGALEETLRAASRSAEAGRRLHKAAIELQNISEIRATKPALPVGRKTIKPPLTIEFKQVDFKYPGSQELALSGLSFKIKPGEHLALVGENGAGKSTILKLLMRQYLPNAGRIEINGVDMRDLDQTSYYALVSHLSQEFFLPEHLTVRENLLIGAKETLSDKEIWRALELARASDFIRNSAKQLETRLTPSFEDGTDFSAGHRQRLCIARTLLRDTDLMILDEPTSAADAKAEYRIFSNIYSRLARKTIIIVSHRFSTVRKADRIMVIERGRIKEQGSHEELMDENGLYREMFDIQAEGYR